MGLDAAVVTLQRQGYAVLGAQSVHALAHTTATDLQALVSSWNDLPADQYLKDGGRYRRRRHLHAKCPETASGAGRSPRRDAGGIGRPTPECAHRDGVDLVAVFLVDRQGIKGGETRVFEADGPNGQRFTLSEPWSVLLLDDARVIHESTPIQPVAQGGHRDTLVVTLRSGRFQDEA